MATAKRTRVTEPVIDYGTLAPVSVPKAAVQKDAAALVPFKAWLKDSKEKGDAKRIPVPSEAAAKQAESYLRKAAGQESLGVSVSWSKQKDGSYIVVFAARDRRQYNTDKPRKPRKVVRKDNESSADFRARQAKYNTALAAWNKANNS